jgi:hypothetical protein
VRVVFDDQYAFDWAHSGKSGKPSWVQEGLWAIAALKVSRKI